MCAQIVVLGASLGGLIAAAELNERGHNVTLIERGRSVGGLYNKTQTPFGTQELGMHVLYANEQHYRHLCAIFGPETFHVLQGPKVDLGASANFGRVYSDSHYPSLLTHPLRETVLAEILTQSRDKLSPKHALEEAIHRFGQTAANNIIAPILRKLWQCEPSNLSPKALHCFFDLRRIVVCEKAEADRLKVQPELDAVIANPCQLQPSGPVFGGRMGLIFKNELTDLNERVIRWAEACGIRIQLGADVSYQDGVLMVDNTQLHEVFDACLVAAPIHLLADNPGVNADRLELSVCYLKLDRNISSEFKSYYVLVHDERHRAGRIVNYDAYNPDNSQNQSSVIAIESIHLPGQAPESDELVTELAEVMPYLRPLETYLLPRSITVWAPTLNNAGILDQIQQSIAQHFGSRPIYFTGMRTDTGVFFSHHTIGLAYDSALACHERLTRT